MRLFFSSHFARRRFTRIALVLFFVFVVQGAVLIPQRVEAQFVPTFVEDVLNNTADWLARTEEKTEKKVEKALDKVAKQALVQSIANVVQNFALRLSSNVAKTLTEGGKGGKPLFDTRQLKNAVSEAGEAAIGDAIDEIGKGIGMNLCQPPDLRLNIGLGLFAQIDQPEKPTCQLNELKDKWKEFGNQFDDPNFLNDFLKISPTESETGIAIGAFLKADSDKAKEEENARLDRLIDKNFRAG